MASGDAHGYSTLNVGFDLTNPGDTHGTIMLNVGFDLENPGDAHGTIMLNVAAGVGTALYPWRENPDLTPRARR